MDYLCCLHQLPAGWSRRMLWSELARINDREGFMSFLLSKRIVVLWTMTLKAAGNSCLYAQICMILSNWWMFEGSPREGTESSTTLLWQQTAISALLPWKYYWYLSSSPPWRLVQWLWEWCAGFALKKLSCAYPHFYCWSRLHLFFFLFQKDHFFVDQETIFLLIRRPSLLSLFESRFIFIFIFPFHAHMFLAFMSPMHIFAFFSPLWSYMECSRFPLRGPIPAFHIKSYLPVEAIAEVNTSELPKQ